MTLSCDIPHDIQRHRSRDPPGRRVLEPLSEYVKIEPQHLGVGQYQHDIAQKKLSCRLEEIVSEAVSFTGK